MGCIDSKDDTTKQSQHQQKLASSSSPARREAAYAADPPVPNNNNKQIFTPKQGANENGGGKDKEGIDEAELAEQESLQLYGSATYQRENSGGNSRACSSELGAAAGANSLPGRVPSESGSESSRKASPSAVISNKAAADEAQAVEARRKREQTFRQQRAVIENDYEAGYRAGIEKQQSEAFDSVLDQYRKRTSEVRVIELVKLGASKDIAEIVRSRNFLVNNDRDRMMTLLVSNGHIVLPRTV